MAHLSLRLVTALVLIAGSSASLAQGGGGGSGSGGGSAGGASSAPSTSASPASPSALGTPAAGSPGAGSAAAPGTTSGIANPGGQSNSLSDITGTANSSTQPLPPPPGTNTAGTALSSGPPANARRGVTTGSAGTGANTKDTDAAVAAEDKMIDSKIKSICRGC